ncbi:iron-containing redox enzyme family protein [Priestia abyssalis]|uniref:iron-containing redox enzyme family protein n=1 Tax=Priestia abyssalis TaxID=1221450 RepID=UPI0009949C27|nr:iron-containing redox enzyme family protein [Priestia abyssalis]
MSQACFFNKPLLKPETQINNSNEVITLSYKEDSLSIEPDDKSIDSIQLFLKSLDGTNSIQEISNITGYSEEEVVVYVNSLDKELFIMEGGENFEKGISGKNFMIKLEEYVQRWTNQKGTDPFNDIVKSNKATKSLLVGFALEYFYVTKRAFTTLMPSTMFQLSPQIKQELREFAMEEFNHDRIMVRALESVGISREDAYNHIPLPSTAALINLLSFWSHHDPLSYMASLYIFEEASDGNEYLQSLEQYDLPKEYIKPMYDHSDVNEDGDHGAISRNLLKHIEYVSLDDQKRVIKNLYLLINTLYAFYDDLVDKYYENEDLPVRLVN